MRQILFLLFLLSASAFSQEKTIAIEGRVVDMVGAVVPNGPVVVINLDTLEVQQLRTSVDGQFRVALLPGRKYQIFAAFQCMRPESMILRAEKPRKVEIKLKANSCGDTT